jgi:hypothetical protein
VTKCHNLKGRVMAMTPFLAAFVYVIIATNIPTTLELEEQQKAIYEIQELIQYLEENKFAFYLRDNEEEVDRYMREIVLNPEI